MSYEYARAREDLVETGAAIVDQLTETERKKLVQWALKNLICPLTKKKVTAVKHTSRFMDFDKRWHDMILISDVMR